MPSLYSKDLFVLGISIATSKTEIDVLLKSQFEMLEADILPYVTYSAGVPKELSDIKYMLSYFTYFEFVKYQSSINTATGQMISEAENGVRLFDNIKASDAYNKGVDIYNTYVTDTNNSLSYINDLGV